MPTATPFNNLITFSRGSNATVTGSNGLIQWAPNNLLLFSEQFDNSYWVKLNASVTANTSVAPDSSTTADTLTSTSSVASTTGTYRNVSLAVGHTMTAYAKAGSSSIAWVSGDNGESYGVFNLANGTVITSGGATASIISVGDGWYRLVVANTTVSNSYFIMGGKDTYTSGHPWANGTWTSGNTIRIWGAQVELGSAATTYNSTTVKNLLGFSEAFNNAAWSKVNASIVTGAAANPVNGAFNAQKLMEDTANSTHLMLLGGGTVGSLETLSIYARPAGRNWLSLQLGTGKFAYFDLSLGALGNVTGGTASIVNAGNGWYRCSLTGTRAGSSNNFIYTASANGTSTYTGDGNSGVYIYGAQLSDSASLDPYVPTPGAAPSSTAFYGPRFDFDPVTLQPRGLLVEEQRTNLALYSEQFDNAAWQKQPNVSVTGINVGVSPSGTATADEVTFTAATNDSIYQSIAVAATTAYTFSIWVKGSGGQVLQVSCQPPAAAAVFTQVTLNGQWQRVAAAATTVGSGFMNVAVDLVSGTTPAIVQLWGAQLEAGAFATSYIPTVASTVTRSADVATISGSLFSQWYRQDEGCIVLEGSTFKPTTVSAGSFFYVNASDGTTSEQANIRLASANVGGLVWDGGVLQAGMDTAYAANAIEKYALALKANDFAFARNGATPATDSSGSMPTVNRLSIGVNAAGSSEQLNGHIRNIRFIPARAADFQLQALST